MTSRRVSAARSVASDRSAASTGREGPFAVPSIWCMPWVDAQTNAVGQWLEWQQAMLQPMLDWHATLAMRTFEPWLAMGLEPFVLRGEEQLA